MITSGFNAIFRRRFVLSAFLLVKLFPACIATSADRPCLLSGRHAGRPLFTGIQDKNNQDQFSVADITRYKQDAARLVSFIEFSMNIIGSDSSTLEEKEAVIYSSYLKIYKDNKVLIEDDLDANRKVPTYKAVQSYLQDIAYFYKKVSFTMVVQNIEFAENELRKPYIKITVNRHLQGIGLYNDTIENSQQRFIELNIDSKNRELKVASIYTTKANEQDELMSWWKQQPDEWKTLLIKESGIKDSIQYTQIKKIILLETLSLNEDKNITDFSALSRLTALKQLDLSGTSISNLDVLRNLIQLEVLNLDNTPVLVIPFFNFLHKLNTLYINNTGISNLEFLSALPSLHKLYCSGTLITNLSPVEGLKFLEDLNCSSTAIHDLSSLSACKNLTKLNISDTQIEGLQQLSSMFNLRVLDLSNTMVNNLEPLQSLRKLTQLSFNNTWVANLKPLNGLPNLKTVYCDNTGIHESSTAEFMQNHKNALVICETEGLSKWWNTMSPEWKKYFRQGRQLADVPTKEALAALVNIDSIDISGNQRVADLAPLTLLSNLKTLKISNTRIASLNPISNLINLQKLDFSHTSISNLDDLSKLNNLVLLFCDDTPTDSLKLIRFINGNKRCLVVYKSAELMNWWGNLSNEWRAVFRLYTRLDAPPTPVQLHSLINQDSITISGKNLISLEPLTEFSHLKYLNLSKCGFSNLPNLETFRDLSVLDISDNPVIDLKAIEDNNGLRVLNCSNTAIKNLVPLEKLSHLEELKCSGTRIKDLEPVSKLTNLISLDISNTFVKKTGYLENLNKLRNFVCYNTPISKKSIDEFSKIHPKCSLTHF